MDAEKTYPVSLTITRSPWDTQIFPFCGNNRGIFFCPTLKSDSTWSGNATNISIKPLYNPSYGLNEPGTSNGNLLESLGLVRIPMLTEAAVFAPSDMMAVADLVQ